MVGIHGGIKLVALHEFQVSLQKSLDYSDAAWWENLYRGAFPDLASMVSIKQDGWAQRGGIDRILVLANGKHLYVDEKVRPDKDYGDILLEYWSNKEQRIKGWILKDLATDYIAYAIVPSRRCYLFPLPTLQRAFRTNGREWIRWAKEKRPGYRIILARNKGYTTESVAIPLFVLKEALSEAMLVNWEYTEK